MSNDPDEPGQLDPVRGIDVTNNRLTCPSPVPGGVFYAETPIKKGLTLWSDVARPFLGEEGLRRVPVRSTTAELLPLPGNVMLSWREPDGTRWSAQASGVDQADLLATLDDLTFNGTSVDPASVPVSWEQSDLPEDTRDPDVLSWDLQYGPRGHYTQDPPGIRLHVGFEVEPVAVAAARGRRHHLHPRQRPTRDVLHRPGRMRELGRGRVDLLRLRQPGHEPARRPG